MEYFNYSPEADEIRNIKTKLSEVMDVMVQNIDKVLERGEKIEVLVTQTNKLQTHSYRMQRSATKLKRRLWWKNVYLWLCIIFCCIILILVVAAIIMIALWKLGIFDSSSGGGKRALSPRTIPEGEPLLQTVFRMLLE